jgi:hypothetical protein
MENISYSGMRLFNNCRRAFKLRYKDRLEPKYAADALSFGKLIHECLAMWYGKAKEDTIFKLINNNYKDLDRGNNKHYKALATALVEGYISKHMDVDKTLNIVDIEFAYDVPIINPKTGRHSKKFRMHGFIDMVTEDINGDIWLWEHKTAAAINENYIERIWHDQQIMIYAINYELMTGRKVKGIVYNVIQKVQLRQGKNETFDEFTFRLTDRYLTDDSLYHGEAILTDNLRLREVRNEIWQITQEIGQCKSYYKNRSQCHGFGVCQYFKICNSGDNPLTIQNYYKEREDYVTDTKEEESNKPF